jgi:hypothetical protein
MDCAGESRMTLQWLFSLAITVVRESRNVGERISNVHKASREVQHCSG